MRRPESVNEPAQTSASECRLPERHAPDVSGERSADDVEQALLEYLTVLEKITEQGLAEGDEDAEALL